MKLASFRVREFRSVWDSGDVGVGEITCLVGKNEAGKTTLLTALNKINPIETNMGDFDADIEYPKKDYGDYQHEVETNVRKPAEVISAKFELEDADVGVVEEHFGKGALRSRIVGLTRTYENASRYSMDFDEAAALAHKIATAALLPEQKGQLIALTSWKEVDGALAAMEQTEAVINLGKWSNVLKASSASYYTWNKLLDQRVPKFLYFDDYYQLAGQENLDTLLKRQDAGKLLPKDHPLLGLINLARMDLKGLLQAKRTVEVTNKLEAAGNQLTKQVLKYWSQNKHLKMKFDVREARSGDPEGMTSGHNIWGQVYDEVHWATTSLGSRSKGFVWFFSFLAWYEDVKREKKDIILLFDEPGLSLHGRAQADLLSYFETELKPHHQVIYTTHSPFMVDAAHLERVRIVQDAGIDATEPLDRENDGTKVLANVFDGSPDSLFPLQGALGYDIHQSLFVGPNSLVVEGAADLLYLQVMSGLLEAEDRIGLSPKWTITPVGGSGKVPTFVSLLAPQKGMNVAVLMDFQKSDLEQIEAMYKKNLLAKKKILTYAHFTNGTEADVEDMFSKEFYVGLVNSEYASALASPINLGTLNANIPRVLKQIVEALKAAPLKKGTFGHYRPARYLTENIAKLQGQIDEPTKARFEKAFVAINKLLK